MKRSMMMTGMMFLLMLAIAGCGKAPSAGGESQGQSLTGDDGGKESVVVSDEISPEEEDAERPFLITVTDKDTIYVEIKKSTYDPSATDYSYNAFFNDRNDETVFKMNISSGGSDWSQCRLCYGEFGDESKTAVSDYGYEDLGDSVKYTIVLNNPSVKISGGDNLPIPLSLFESVAKCLAQDPSDAYIEYGAERILKFDVDYSLLAAKENGLKKLEALLYQNDKDREFLTPTCEDYRVDIFDTKVVVFEGCRIDRAPASGLYVFGTNPEGTISRKPCKVYRVYEYDSIGKLVSYKEKTVFESESDALHIAATNGINGTHGLWFIDWIGVNEVPADFTDEQGLKVICDENLPVYYSDQGKAAGYTADVQRYDNTWYLSFVQDEAGFRNKEFFSGIGETEILGDYLSAEGNEFSADNADDEGFIYLGSGDEKATVYYSKPDAHRHNISDASDVTGMYPDDFVPMPYDDQYFTPISDDYVLYYSRFEDYGDYRFNDKAVLISFDDAGNIIDAKYRYFRPSNMVNPMSELVESTLIMEGTRLLYQDDTYAYFDIIDCTELKPYAGDGTYGDRFNKTELLEQSVEEEFVWMPMGAWSSDTGIFVSK